MDGSDELTQLAMNAKLNIVFFQCLFVVAMIIIIVCALASVLGKLPSAWISVVGKTTLAFGILFFGVVFFFLGILHQSVWNFIFGLLGIFLTLALFFEALELCNEVDRNCTDL